MLERVRGIVKLGGATVALLLTGCQEPPPLIEVIPSVKYETASATTERARRS